jgi:hypothetical protein
VGVKVLKCVARLMKDLKWRKKQCKITMLDFVFAAS